MKLEGVLFDLDGTVVELNLDFDRIRQEIGIKERFILEAINKMSGNNRITAMKKLRKMEIESAHKSRLMPGVKELFDFLKNRDIRSGIVTRNCRDATVAIINRHGLDIDCIVTREDAPPKPSPEPIKVAMEKLFLSPERTLYVGDFLFDILAGKNAGVKTVLLLNERNMEFREMADITVNSMDELKEIIERML